MGNIADELGLGFVQGDFAGNVLHRNGNAFDIFFSLIEHRVQQNSENTSAGLLQRNPKFHRFRISQHRLK